jgi:hypothetical protein
MRAIGRYLEAPENAVVLHRPSTRTHLAGDLSVRIAQQTAFRVMGLSVGVSLSEINDRYRQIARMVHSDKTGQSDDMMKLLNRARDILRGDFSQVLPNKKPLMLTYDK